MELKGQWKIEGPLEKCLLTFLMLVLTVTNLYVYGDWSQRYIQDLYFNKD